MRMSAGDYELDDDPGRVDADAAVAFLTTEAYWGRWRGAQDIKGQIAAAWRVVGVYDRAGAMVGFARALGDGGNAYLADVYVLPEHRGAGLGQAIVRMMIEDGPGAGMALDAAHLRRARPVPAVRLRLAERPVTWSARRKAEGAARQCTEPPPGTLVGKVVRLEPLQHQHVAGAARRGQPAAASCTAGPRCRRTRPRSARYVETAVAARDGGTAVPFAVVRTADDTVIGSTRFFDLGYWAWPDGRARTGPGHLRDRLHLAQPDRHQDRREHRDEAPHAHARLRGLAGALGVPAHRRPEPAVTGRHGADRRALRGHPARAPARHGPASRGTQRASASPPPNGPRSDSILTSLTAATSDREHRGGAGLRPRGPGTATRPGLTRAAGRSGRSTGTRG